MKNFKRRAHFTYQNVTADDLPWLVDRLLHDNPAGHFEVSYVLQVAEQKNAAGVTRFVTLDSYAYTVVFINEEEFVEFLEKGDQDVK